VFVVSENFVRKSQSELDVMKRELDGIIKGKKKRKNNKVPGGLTSSG
jgi:hypothetical protein